MCFHCLRGLKHCLRHVFPLPSVAETLPSPCVSTAFAAALPWPCVSTAFAGSTNGIPSLPKAVPSPCMCLACSCALPSTDNRTDACHPAGPPAESRGRREAVRNNASCFTVFCLCSRRPQERAGCSGRWEAGEADGSQGTLDTPAGVKMQVRRGPTNMDYNPTRWP